jgi:hypothetical protein
VSDIVGEMKEDQKKSGTSKGFIKFISCIIQTALCGGIYML